MGNVIMKKTVDISMSGVSLYILLDTFAKEFLTGQTEIDKDDYSAHLEFSTNKKGEHYMAVWLAKKK